jgi:hypothetical protein
MRIGKGAKFPSIVTRRIRAVVFQVLGVPPADDEADRILLIKYKRVPAITEAGKSSQTARRTAALPIALQACDRPEVIERRRQPVVRGRALR